MTEKGPIFDPQTINDRWLRAAILGGTMVFSLLNPAAYLIFLAMSGLALEDDLRHFDNIS